MKPTIGGEMRGPDFLVVGAPKCGTTAIHTYLSRNPSLYLAPKEPNFFGSDLEFLGRRINRASYEELFPESADRVRGDVSVWYLLSHTAAREIREFNAESKIIVMLRNPVDQMYSMHSQALHTLEEDEPSFTRALELESDRKSGLALPRFAGIPHAVFYRELATYSVQIRRYLDVFPRDQVHFILLEDLESRPNEVWADLHAFLGVEPGERPEMTRVNSNKTHRSRVLANAATFVPRVVVPKLGLRRLPRTIKDRLVKIYRWFMEQNRAYTPRAEMDPVVRSELVHEFRYEISELEAILDRDLSHWRR